MPAKKPTKIKEIQGNPGKRKLNDDVEFDGTLQDPPRDLSYSEKKVWNYIVKNSPEGLFQSPDLGQLKIYCIAFCLHKEAYKHIKKDGAVIIDEYGKQQKSPWVDIMNKQVEIIRGVGSDLGFSPVARSRISMSNGGPKEKERRFKTVDADMTKMQNNNSNNKTIN